ncbi:MAG: family 10 glycosylhydrolase, partial [Gemmatimonadota bacterium]|nr:family 10 glycosylhydrolase [Gemmatimonadota bacterium]
PEPFWDPLELAVTEAHRRGLELHAWFNPYRARHPSARGPEAASHIARTRPELVRRYGRNLWMDPGEKAVQEHSLRVMLDVVRRYDVDGVHIDDYFYPYPETDSAGRPIPFPDEVSYARYASSGGRLSRDDWRRENVDSFIRRLYDEVKREKRWVQVGVSPFGIWRPGHPAGITSRLDQYGELYADALKWWTEGWLDYFVPQLYWPIAQTPQSYPILLRWWAEHNTTGRHLYPGNFTSRVAWGAEPYWPAAEVIGQIYVTRGQAGAGGNIHFSMRALMRDVDSLSTRLATEAYAESALIPASPWLGDDAPEAPSVQVAMGSGGTRELSLIPGAGTPAARWVVREQDAEGRWRTAILPADAQRWPLAAGTRRVRAFGVGRTGMEGAVAELQSEP